MPNPYGSTLGARYNLWIEEAIRGEIIVEIDRAIESLRNAFRQGYGAAWPKMTVVQKVRVMWERSSYYKKLEAKKKLLETIAYNKKHKPKPYYRVKERW